MKNTCEKVHVCVYFSKIFNIFLYNRGSGTATFKEHLFFLNKISNVFEIKKSIALGQIKPHFSFWLKKDFRKMTSNRNIQVKQTENFAVRPLLRLSVGDFKLQIFGKKPKKTWSSFNYYKRMT